MTPAHPVSSFQGYCDIGMRIMGLKKFKGLVLQSVINVHLRLT